MEKVYKLKRLVPSFVALMVMIWVPLMVSCSNENIPNDNIDDLTPYRSVERTINFSENFDFTAGIILLITKVDKNNFLFLDFAQRSLFYLDSDKKKIRQVGQHGEGPGEYRNPLYFQTDGNDTVAFTDISNSSIKFINMDGEYIHQIQHRLGGGKQFILHEKDAYVLGGLTDIQQNYYQLTVLERDGNMKKEIFPAKAEYENQIRAYGMGGITKIGDQVFFMNSIEPIIYIYNTITEEMKEVAPFDSEDKRFTLNDGISLMQKDPVELRSIYNDGGIVIFQRVDQIQINGEVYLMVSARKGSELFTYFLDTDTLTVQYYYTPSQNIVGVYGNFIYESDIYSEFGAVDEITFSIKND